MSKSACVSACVSVCVCVCVCVCVRACVEGEQKRLTRASRSFTLGGAKMVCTMNLCLLFSFGS